MKERKIGKQIFIALLGIQAIGELAIGTMLLFNLPVTLESGFGITYNSDLDVLGLALGLYLLLLTSLLLLSIVWTIKENLSGITVGIIVGIFLFSFGILAFLKFGDANAIYIDSIRGAATVIFALLAKKELQISKQ